MFDTVFAIDRDVKRRASISYCLNSRGVFAEPFETTDEFIQCWPKTGVILIHDDEKAVRSLMRGICSRQSWLPIVAFSESPRPSQIVEAVLDGAVGYAAWSGSGDALLSVLRKSAKRCESALGGAFRHATATSQVEKLSKREREILAGMVDGLSNRLIGEYLSISPRTVELHRANMLNKIGAKSSADAIRLAIEAALPPFEASMIAAE